MTYLNAFPRVALALSCFAFCALTFLIWGGTGFGLVPLLLVAPLAWVIPNYRRKTVDKSIWWLCAALAAYGLLGIWSAARGSELALAEVDQPARMILAVLLITAAYKIGIPNWVFRLGMATLGIVAGYAILDFYFNSNLPRPRSPFNAIIWGNLALIALVANTFLLVREITLKRFNALQWQIAHSLAIIGSALGVILSLSRGAWLASIIVAACIAAYWLINGSAKRALIICLLGTSLAIGLVATPQTGVYKRIEKVFIEIRQFQQNPTVTNSSGLRLQMWRTGFEAFSQSPAIGLGETGVAEYETEQIEQKRLSSWVKSTGQLHNEYIDTAAKSGLLGIILLSFLYWRLAIASPRNPAYKQLLQLITLSYIAFGLTNTILVGMNGTMFLIGILVFLLAAEPEKASD